jgi:beta-lactamase class A
MKKNGVSMISLAAAALVGAGLSYLFLEPGKADPRGTAPANSDRPRIGADCSYNIVRLDGYKRVRPLVSSEPMCESPRFDALRNSIGTLVDGMKAAGQVSSASVYLRDFRKAEWTWYNGDEQYDPGSMLKVPLLLAWLAMYEQDPTALDKTFRCEQKDCDVLNTTAFPSEQAQLNLSYTVRQLLELSIVHSDNRATMMLLRHMPPEQYLNTFTELGLPKPAMQAKAYRMTVRDYSVFMKALYNSSVLSPIDSEYALDLMTRAEFNKGLVAGLPAGVDIAHKFGEAGTPQEKQLHETGLVYAAGNPYLITVMTRGSDVDSLASAIASVSRLVYERMRTP